MLMVEARRAERIRSFLRARIVFNHGATTLDCVVRNLSATGAKLELSSAISVPTEFDLEIPQRSKVHRARMMWRDADFAGVLFVESDRPAETDDGRLEHVLAENRKLRKSVAALTKRLEDLGQDVRDLI